MDFSHVAYVVIPCDENKPAMKFRVTVPTQSMLAHVFKPFVTVVIQFFRRITFLEQAYVRVEIIFNVGPTKLVSIRRGKLKW
jgi:hypothetical protein